MISFIVCSNGYGHLKRVLLVVTELIKKKPELPITLFCPPTHIELAKQEINFANNSLITYESSISLNEINWLREETITLERYERWSDDLKNSSILRRSKLVVSDNNVAPLGVFKNSVLMGSFLWPDVVTFHNSEVEAIVESELTTLQKNKPVMLCVKSMAMPAVIENTNSIGLPWFCERYVSHMLENNKKSILITGGGTALVNETLASVAIELAKIREDIQIWVDAKIWKLLQQFGMNSIKEFGFSDEDFASLTSIVCRPGIGILTDCMRYGIPPYVINDGFNKEINNNAQRVESIGIGKATNSFEHTPESIARGISEFLKNNESLLAHRQEINKQETNGAVMAAEFLISQLNLI